MYIEKVHKSVKDSDLPIQITLCRQQHPRGGWPAVLSGSLQSVTADPGH